MKINTHQIVERWTKGEDLADVAPDVRRAIDLVAAGYMDEKAIRAAGVDTVKSLKADRDLFQVRANTSGPILERTDDDGFSIPWALSTDDVDRMGDIIEQDGWDLRDFNENPVLLYAHEHKGEIQGNVTGLKVERLASKDDGERERQGLIGNVNFAARESDLAATRFRLARAGFLRAGSVGLRVLGSEDPDDETREELGMPAWGMRFTKSLLLEFSLVPIPANAAALQQAKSAGMITDSDADYQAAISDPTEKEWAKWVRRRARSHVSMAPQSVSRGFDPEAIERLLTIAESLAKQIERLATTLDMHARATAALAEQNMGGGKKAGLQGPQGDGAPQDDTRLIESVRGLVNALKS